MSQNFETPLARRARQQTQAFDLIKAGYSFNQASEIVGVSHSAVANWAKQVGLPSPAGSRHSDFSHRLALARKIRASGGTWQDVADAWARVEGFVVSQMNAWNWTQRNAPDVIKAGKGRRPSHVRAALVAAYSAGASA